MHAGLLSGTGGESQSAESRGAFSDWCVQVVLQPTRGNGIDGLQIKGRPVTSQIDVLMSTYNAGRFLPETLASIQAQTIRDIRIIVVDDGSTDNSAEVLAQAAVADPRILIVTQPNRGIVAALNAGLAHCTAPFIARHDADDLSAPDRLERQLRYFDHNSDCIALSGSAWQIDELGLRLGTKTRVRDPALGDPFRVPAREPYLLQPMLMVRRSALVAANGYRPLLVSEDSDLYWRLQAIGRLHNMDEVLGSYRMHPQSISSQSIVSGRQTALCSQLVAVSAQRRKRFMDDLVFDEELVRAVRQARSMEDMLAIGRTRLQPSEMDWFAGAIAAKLIEFCFYRPFELTVEDCRFIRRSTTNIGHVTTPENAAFLRESIIGTAVRLALKGLKKEAFLLPPPRLLPVMVLRVVFRAILSDRSRTTIKRLVGRRGPILVAKKSA
ncbi:MAG: glycosyltransferase family 2 protein [Janthinobacterium lividum]